jgi:hypothetical protein
MKYMIIDLENNEVLNTCYLDEKTKERIESSSKHTNKESLLKEVEQEIKNYDTDILKMYELVFKREVQDYIESLNSDLEVNKEYLTLTDDEKDIIAHKLVFKNDYLWQTIHETIDYEIGHILNERRGKEDE